MTWITLTAPARIRGPMTRGTDWRIRAERQTWVADQIAAGHSYAAIAKALGVSAPVVRQVVRQPRITNPRCKADRGQVHGATERPAGAASASGRPDECQDDEAPATRGHSVSCEDAPVTVSWDE